MAKSYDKCNANVNYKDRYTSKIGSTAKDTADGASLKSGFKVVHPKGNSPTAAAASRDK